MIDTLSAPIATGPYYAACPKEGPTRVNLKWAIPEKVRNPYVEEVGFSVQGGGYPSKNSRGSMRFREKSRGSLKLQQKSRGVPQELAKTSRGSIKNKGKIQRGSLKFRQKIQGGWPSKNDLLNIGGTIFFWNSPFPLPQFFGKPPTLPPKVFATMTGVYVIIGSFLVVF